MNRIPGFLNTWNEFIPAFLGYFQITTGQKEAQFALEELTQGTASAAEFVTLFRGYAIRTGYGDVELLNKFRQKINKGLKSKLDQLIDLPDILIRWYDAAIIVDKRYRENRVWESHYGTKTHEKKEAPKREGKPQATITTPAPNPIPRPPFPPQNAH